MPHDRSFLLATPRDNRVNQDIIIATAKRFIAFVNPNGLHVYPEQRWQLTNSLAINIRLHLRIACLKLRVHLNFDGFAVWLKGIEQQRIYGNENACPIVCAPVEHLAGTNTSGYNLN
jgi:hypothetical protein